MLQRRGVDDLKKLPYFPYRDDGTVIWNVIQEFAKDYVNMYVISFTPSNSEGIFLMPKSHLLSGIIIHVILYMTKNYRILQMSCQLMELVQLVAWAW